MLVDTSVSSQGLRMPGYEAPISMETFMPDTLNYCAQIKAHYTLKQMPQSSSNVSKTPCLGDIKLTWAINTTKSSCIIRLRGFVFTRCWSTIQATVSKTIP